MRSQRHILILAVVAIVVAIPVVNGAAGVPQVTGLSLPDPSRTFDVASVKQNMSGDRSASSKSDMGRFTITNMSLKTVLLQMFAIQDAQLVGGPGWLTTDRFDIVAEAGTATPRADLNVMMQNLLIERFAMKMHVETRSLPIYALRLARADGRLGPDLRAMPCAASTSGQPCGPGAVVTGGAGGPAAGGGFGGGVASMGGAGVGVGAAPAGPNMSMSGATMASFARALSRNVDRIVIDRTGLEGRYELTLRYSPPSAAGSEGGSTDSAPELFTALQEQLGLKLESTRGPVEVLVIDHVERPPEN